MKCNCKDWKENIDKLNAPFAFAFTHPHIIKAYRSRMKGTITKIVSISYDNQAEKKEAEQEFEIIATIDKTKVKNEI